MRFRIKGVARAGEVVALELEAAGAAEAHALAEHQGLRVLAVRAARRWPGWPRARREAFPLLLFSQELATLLTAGLALVDALESLAEKEADASARRVLAALVRRLYEGKSLSQALAASPEVFPELYVALVQASERTGAVGEALARYVAYRARIDEVKQKMIGASVYPALLLLVGCGVLLFLVGYVVPRFSVVFADVGAELPWLSRALLAAGQFLHTHQGLLLAALGVALAGGALGLHAGAGRAALGRLARALPALRERLFLYELARCYRSLGILLQGGIPVLAALAMVRGLLAAPARARLERAAQAVREGQALSHALEAQRLATPVALRLLRAGEQSGRLGAMLERAADFHDAELARTIEWFVRLFEPLLMTFIGLLIGVVVILMYIPIFELAGSIQ